MLDKRFLLVGLLLMGLLLAACETTDSASDPTSAQNMQPSLVGYDVQDTDNIIDAVTSAAGAAALASGNVPLVAAIERINTTLGCLQEVGAVSARTYVQNENVSVVPQAGVSLIVNQDRVERNLLSCVVEPPLSAQAVLEIEPCIDSGTFTQDGETFFYAYLGAGSQICAAFRAHYEGLGAVSVAPVGE